ncbi:MAG: MBL fold metallo-hydrolase [Proteobacteria bacterium]|nr:MBL fold metallo-hydrolase [Pseudomonadota bacterium]
MNERNESPGIRITVLASGSKGNATVISDGVTSVLVDTGLSAKETARRMALAGLFPEELSAVIVTHEHRDHVIGVGPFCRRHKVAAFMTRETLQGARPIVGVLPAVEHFRCGRAFSVGTLSFRPFSTSHDAADPMGFTLEACGIKIGMVTDLGVATSMVAHHLTGCRALILEANHDPKMLEQGPYPWSLKQRVASRIGHLSNEDARDLLGRVLNPGMTHIILGHLSETNNLPEKAMDVVSQALSGHRARLLAARQKEITDIFVQLESAPPAAK